MVEDLDEYSEAYAEDALYALDNRLILKWYPQRILEKLQTGTLLELGLGHGYTAEIFGASPKVERYRVLEGSLEVIEQFRRRRDVGQTELVHVYFEDYASDERFTNIVMGFVLEHVDDPDLILSRYVQHVLPGGSVFIAVPNAAALNRRLGVAAGLLERLDLLSDADRAQGHKRYFDLASLRALVERNGLRIKSVEGLFLKPLTTVQLTSLNLSEAVLTAMLEVGREFPELCTGILVEATLG